MNPELPPREFLEEFILEQAPHQPADKRIFLYRALAAVSENKLLKKECSALADEMDLIEERHRQLFLNFHASKGDQKSPTTPPPENDGKGHSKGTPNSEDV